jgi:hypothetical protein
MFVVVTVNDELYKPLAEWTVDKNKKVYCERHGYVLKHYEDGAESLVGKPMRAGNPPIPEDHLPIGWAKVYAMKDAFEKYHDCEWIFNTDCDSMITNMDIKLEDIIKEYADENTHVLIPADCNGINCGNMFIKNSPIGKAFLDTIIAGMSLYRNWYMFENQLIQDLCVGTYLTEQGVIPGGTLWGRVCKIVTQRGFNSYDYKELPLLKNRPNYNDILGNNGEWKEGDFMIQWPATSLEYRIKAAETLYKSEKIISR